MVFTHWSLVFAFRDMCCNLLTSAGQTKSKYLYAGNNRAVYTRENKPQLALAAAYMIHERNYLYEYKLPDQDKPRLEKAVNVDFVPFIRSVRVSCKPQPE